jgi:D-ribose pyranose/furanose isomerase RbsD
MLQKDTTIYLIIGLLVSACTSLQPIQKETVTTIEETAKEPQRTIWQEKIDSEISQLGANNWIVVTEKAYPIINNLGVKVIDTGVTLPEALAYVFEAIESQGHVWPRIYSLKEFEFVEEDFAPGIKELAAKRESALAARKSQTITKKTSEMMLKVAMNDFRILVVKTESAYPYSSIFMELDCGYWNSESEQALNVKMSTY